MDPASATVIRHEPLLTQSHPDPIKVTQVSLRPYEPSMTLLHSPLKVGSS